MLRLRLQQPGSAELTRHPPLDVAEVRHDPAPVRSVVLSGELQALTVILASRRFCWICYVQDASARRVVAVCPGEGGLQVTRLGSSPPELEAPAARGRAGAWAEVRRLCQSLEDAVLGEAETQHRLHLLGIAPFVEGEPEQARQRREQTRLFKAAIVRLVEHRLGALPAGLEERLSGRGPGRAAGAVRPGGGGRGRGGAAAAGGRGCLRRGWVTRLAPGAV